MATSAQKLLFGGLGGARAILPLDVEGGPSVAAAFGVKPLTRAWADGPLFQLYNFDDPGSPFTWSAKGLEGDIEALAGFLEVDPDTGIGGALINIAYDHSGNGRDFTQSGDILQKPDLWLIRRKVYYFGGGFLSVVNGNTGGNFMNSLPVFSSTCTTTPCSCCTNPIRAPMRTLRPAGTRATSSTPAEPSETGIGGGVAPRTARMP